MRRFRDNVKYYSEEIKKDATNSNAYYHRGFAYFKLKQFSPSILDFNKAIQLNPEMVIAYLERGFCL